MAVNGRDHMGEEPRIPALADAYQAPRVERVLTPAELEREVLYAGEPTNVDQVDR
jgi:hypothetical protein